MRPLIPLLFSLSIAFPSLASDEPKPKSGEKAATQNDIQEKSDDETLAAQRLAFMKSSAGEYEFVLGPDFKNKLTMEPDPLLRFTNAVSGLKDGGFMLW